MNLENPISEIYQLEQTIRDFINEHRNALCLLKDQQKWLQICSCLDVIGDTRLAIDAYGGAEYPRCVGLKYLYTYGILQALFILQDAVSHLTEAFGVTHKPSEAVQKIRNYRNAAIGHPTKQDRDSNHRGVTFYNFINRSTISKESFEFGRYSAGKQSEILKVNLTEAIDNQMSEVTKSLRAIVTHIEEEDKAHKEKFKDSPLKAILHHNIIHYFEKILGGIDSQDQKSTGMMHVNHVREDYEKFKTAIEARNEYNDMLDIEFNHAFHALTRLDEYLSDLNENIIRADAEIYHLFLIKQHEKFVKFAEEIDASYKL